MRYSLGPDCSASWRASVPRPGRKYYASREGASSEDCCSGYSRHLSSSRDRKLYTVHKPGTYPLLQPLTVQFRPNRAATPSSINGSCTPVLLQSLSYEAGTFPPSASILLCLHSGRDGQRGSTISSGISASPRAAACCQFRARAHGARQQGYTASDRAAARSRGLRPSNRHRDRRLGVEAQPARRLAHLRPRATQNHHTSSRSRASYCASVADGPAENRLGRSRSWRRKLSGRGQSVAGGDAGGQSLASNGEREPRFPPGWLRDLGLSLKIRCGCSAMSKLWIRGLVEQRSQIAGRSFGAVIDALRCRTGCRNPATESIKRRRRWPERAVRGTRLQVKACHFSRASSRASLSIVSRPMNADARAAYSILS